MVRIRVPGPPVPKERPRMTKSGIVYTPKKTALKEGHIAEEWRRAYGGPIEGAVSISMDFCMPIPRSWPKAKKERALRGEILPETRPDIDNLVKLVLDALNGVGYKDDKQVVEVAAIKVYGATPETWVTVKKIHEE